MKKLSLLAVLFCLAAGSFNLSANDVEYIHPYKLNPVNDGIQLGLGAALAGSGMICNSFLHLNKADYSAAELNKADIPAMDQMFMNPYNKPVDIISTVTEVISLSSPLIMLTVPKTEYMELGVMYAETLMFAYGIKEWGKFFVGRARPYSYYDNVPQKYIDNGDWNNSFPSGHSTMSFASAAFLSSVVNQYYPDSDIRFWVTGCSFGLAATTAALRMVSGNHFFTDVLTGAVIGTLCGFVVPYLHTSDFYKKFERKNSSVETVISPMGFSINYKF